MTKSKILLLISFFALEINSMEFKENETENYIELNDVDEDFYNGGIDEDFCSGPNNSLNNSVILKGNNLKNNLEIDGSSSLKRSCSDENFLNEGINYQIKRTKNEINKIHLLIERTIQESTDESILKIADQFRELKKLNITLQRMYIYLVNSSKSKYEKDQKDIAKLLKKELENMQKKIDEKMKDNLNEFKKDFIKKESSIKQINNNAKEIGCMDSIFSCLKN